MNILMLDTSPIPYTPETPYLEPLGGSETAFTLLARGLVQRGHAVVLLNNTYTPWRSPDGRLVVTHLAFLDQVFDRADVIIANRTVHALDRARAAGKPYFYWSHDAYDQTHLVGVLARRDVQEALAGVWCVSEWQRQTFARYLGVPPEKMTVVGDPIDYALYAHPRPKLNPKVFIFASVPYKGLDFLPLLWSDIRREAKDDELELWVFSSMNLYRQPQEDEKYREIFAQLASLPGVRLHDVISMRELAARFLQAGFYLHPCTYHETFGLAVAQHLACGGLPVAPRYGALPEVTQDVGLLSPYPNVWDRRCYEDLVLTAAAAAKGEIEGLEQRRARARRLARDYDYVRVARRVERALVG